MSASGLPKGFEPECAMPSPTWLAARRASALRRFQAVGIPHRRIEEWKYSDLRNAIEAEETNAQTSATGYDPFAAIRAHRIVIRDGRLDSDHSAAADGIELFDLSTADAPDWVKQNLGEILTKGAMGQASLALMQGGIALRVLREVLEPIHLRFLGNSAGMHARVLIVVEESASMTLLESHVPRIGLGNIGLEVVLKPNAQMSHMRLAEGAPAAIHIEEIGVRLARYARYRAHYSQVGARLSRIELAASLEGEGAELDLSGTSVLAGKLHADVTTHIDHVAGKTASRQLFKFIVGGQARGIYQGKISVEKGADGSDSRQTAKALLLGARAEADLKPELEILADDVKCAHGAAVGELDADSLFYLRSRGIDETDARALLTRAFLYDAIAGIARDDLRHAVADFIERGFVHALETEQ